MVRVWILCVAAIAAALLAAVPAQAFTRSEQTLTAGDGVPLAATLFVPDGQPPAGGWPAVVYMHGLGGTRADASAIAQLMGVVGEEYVVLAFDARGHGASGGLVGIDGPAEVADVATVYGWLRDRADVADDRIGAWGISYGGGAAWGSLAAGVPWAAIEPVETWVDLRTALAPQDLLKSGVA
ncbi:MAG: CocE/NonD family hydrolase, partial [Thermoleophilia bacterium]|nr:CocE/NonD family hydrolase [Thermoleophilia bacterium]